MTDNHLPAIKKLFLDKIMLIQFMGIDDFRLP